MANVYQSLDQKRRLESRHKKRHMRIWEMTKNSYYHPFGYYPVDKHGDYTNNKDEIAYYKRISGSRMSKFLKRQSNKKIRRKILDEALKGGDYKKWFDYWWELY